MEPLDPIAGNNKPERFPEFSRIFLFESDVLECAYYFFYINRFKSIPIEDIYIFGQKKFAGAKYFFEVSF